MITVLAGLRRTIRPSSLTLDLLCKKIRLNLGVFLEGELVFQQSPLRELDPGTVRCLLRLRSELGAGPGAEFFQSPVIAGKPPRRALTDSPLPSSDLEPLRTKTALSQSHES